MQVSNGFCYDIIDKNNINERKDLIGNCSLYIATIDSGLLFMDPLAIFKKAALHSGTADYRKPPIAWRHLCL